MIGRGIWTGLGVFALLAALAYLTPLRAPVLRTAGETYPGLQHRVELQRRTLDTLQMQASNGPLSPARQNLSLQTQRDLAASQQLLESWEQAQTRISPFGFVAWCLDLFPWLAAFGLAFPILGALIAAQAAPRAPKRAAEPYPENPPSVPVTPARPAPPRMAPAPASPSAPSAPASLAPPAPTHAPRHPSHAPTPGNPAARHDTPPAPMAVPKPDFERIGKPVVRDASSPASGSTPAELARHPALDASRPAVALPAATPAASPSASPAQPASPTPPVAPAATAPPASAASGEAWGFRHQPTPVESRRPKAPPVRSPHADHSQGSPEIQDPQGNDAPQAGA